MFNFVDFSIRRGGGIDGAAGADLQRLYLELFGLKDDGRFAIRGDAIHASWGTGGDIHDSGIIGSHRPNVSGGRGIQAFERRGQFESSGVADCYSRGGAFG